MTTPQERIKEIEAEIKTVMGIYPEEYFRNNGYKKEQVKHLEALAWERRDIMDNLFIETAESKKRLIQLNDLVYELKRKMLRRMLTLYRLNVLTGNDPDFDGDYEILGRIEVEVYYDPYEAPTDNDTVLALSDDSLYESDFRYILPAIRELSCRGMSIVDGIVLTNIRHHSFPKDYEPTADEIFDFHYYELEDNKPWSVKKHELKERHAYIKEPLYGLYSGQLSTPDILRINSFDVQVELWCQNFNKTK